jgi:hypothetical protein
MEKRVLRGRLELRADRGELDHVDSLERPTMRIGYFLKLIACFGQRDVEHFLARLRTGEKIFQRESRLAGARFAFEQIKPIRGQPATQDIV